MAARKPKPTAEQRPAGFSPIEVNPPTAGVVVPIEVTPYTASPTVGPVPAQTEEH